MASLRSLGRLTVLASLSACGSPTPPAEPLEPAPEAVEEEGPVLDGVEGCMPLGEAQALAAQIVDIPIDASIAGLTEGEREAVTELMAVGELFHRLYEDLRHPDAAAVRAHFATAALEGEAATHLDVLRELYDLFRGPVAYVPGTGRVLLAPVTPYAPTRNLYPEGTTAEGLTAYAEAHPEVPGLLEVRTYVRRRTEANLAADLATLDAHPVLDVLHPGLRGQLAGEADPEGYYAVPYSVAFPDVHLEASARLSRAAALVRGDDAPLADYFEQRARDLLTDDYEAGDALWVSIRPERLNAQVGAYETYDDNLLGVRAMPSVSILVRRGDATETIDRAVAHLPDFEAALPGGASGPVRTSIPVGVFDVYADYGQARGANTASILPNEARIVRRFGRTILIRGNILLHEVTRAEQAARFRAATHDAHADDLGERGAFHRTVFHEVGHYLGPKRTRDGRRLDEALGNLQNLFEEMKADLVSLWLLPRLEELGILTAEEVRHAYASGILRVALSSEPPESASYGRMQLMQQNVFLERGVLRFEDGRWHIDYGAFPQVVAGLLAEVFEVQRAGDREAAEAMVARLTTWDPAIQGVVAARVAEAGSTYRRVVYAALGRD
jgi:hypothetical protein